MCIPYCQQLTLVIMGGRVVVVRELVLVVVLGVVMVVRELVLAVVMMVGGGGLKGCVGVGSTVGDAGNSALVCWW